MQPFLQLDPAGITEYFGKYRQKSIPEGALVCDVISVRHTVTIVVAGSVRASLMSAKGNERLFFYARSCCGFGDSLSFGVEPATAAGLHVTALERCEVLCIPHADFLLVCERNPAFLMWLLAIAHRKIAHAIEQLQYATFADTTCQLAALLQALALWSTDSAGPRCVEMTHQQLADATGRTRVSVTYALDRLQRAGAIRLGRGRIEVLDNQLIGQYAAEHA